MNLSDLNFTTFRTEEPSKYVLIDECRNWCITKNIDVNYYPLIFSVATFIIYALATIDWRDYRQKEETGNKINRFFNSLLPMFMIASIIANLLLFIFKVV